MNAIQKMVRRHARVFAQLLNVISGSKLTPNMVTLTGLIAHIPIAWLIYQQELVWAAFLLIIFGLLDTLDGELARLQNRTSPVGMILDSVSDRVKEVFLYCGIGAFFNATGSPHTNIAVIGAIGASLCTSYVNAWGDAVLSSHGVNNHQTNKSFRSGLLSFEVRIFLLVAGLLFNKLEIIVYIILILAVVTIMQRLITIRGKLL